MDGWKHVRALCAGAFGLGLAVSGASAADLLLKAPPPPAAPVPLDVHGFFDLTFANDYITPRGLLVTNTGLTTQVLTGLVLDLYKSPNGFINDVSFTMGSWNDLWSQQNDPAVGAWNEFDWFLDVDVRFAQFWKFGVEYGEFLPPAHGTTNTSFLGDEPHVQFALSYDDAHWGLPVVWNPYVKLFYLTTAKAGADVVVLGKPGDTYDVEIGMVPTIDLKKYWNLPWGLTMLVPTWFTVGPTDFWNRNNGTTNFCGPVPAAFTSGPPSSACPLSNFGVVSTGVTLKAPIDVLLPSRLGNWYIKGGFQYYHLLNDALVAAQEFTGAAGNFAPPLGLGGYGFGNYASAHRDITVAFVGTGFSF